VCVCVCVCVWHESEEHYRFHGIENRAVSGASTQIAIELLLDLELRWVGIVSQEGVECHDHSRCTAIAIARLAQPMARVRAA
jgi:hypothetical protein